MTCEYEPIIFARSLAVLIVTAVLSVSCGGGSSSQPPSQNIIGANVIGLLAGKSVVLQNNGSDYLTVSANGTFDFNKTYSIGSSYGIQVSSQPVGETCTVISNASGVIQNAATLIGVSCVLDSVSGTLIPIPVATGNVVPILLDAGPVPGSAQINIAYVSVTICSPGTSGATLACQTIDHVALDTGSSGLRLLKSVLFSNLNLPPVNNVSSQPIGECLPFGTGTTWGAVRLADIYLGGEIATSVPFQDIGDQPGGITTVPTDCSNTGAIETTQDLLGANGILGVGLFPYDCDLCLSQPIPAAYYSCSASNCANTTVTSSQAVKNPVTAMQQDNNGVLVRLPAVAASGVTTLAGSLIFGIGTQSNNALGGATVYATDVYGNFNTIYKGISMPGSFIDSGSNGLFFNDASISLCAITLGHIALHHLQLR